MKYQFQNELEMLDKKNNSLLSVLHYTTNILLLRNPYYVFRLLATLYIAKRYNKKRMSCLEFQSLPEDLFKCLRSTSNRTATIANINACILVNSSTLETLGISSYSWIKIKSPSLSTALPSYLAQVVAISDLEDSVAVVTNLLYYNLSQSSVLLNAKAFVEKSNTADGFVPLIASLVKISFLQTCDINISVLGTVLSNYFQRPCFLQPNDVFAIDVKKHASDVIYQNVKAQILYFKIIRIQGPDDKTELHKDMHLGYYVLKNLSTLIQIENKQGYIPQTHFTFIKGKEVITGNTFRKHLLSTLPAGLEQYRDEVAECIHPFTRTTVCSFPITPLFLLCGPQGVGKENVIRNVSETFGLNVWSFDSLLLQGSPPGYAEGKLKYAFNKVQDFAPCIFVLKNAEVLCKDKDGNEDSRAVSAFHDEVQKLYQKTSTFPVITVAMCNSKDGTTTVTPGLARSFLHVICMENPSDSQRTSMLQWLLKMHNITAEVDLSYIASQTSGFLYADLVALVSLSVRNIYKRLKKTAIDQQEVQENFLTKWDFEEALGVMQAAYSDAIDAPKIPKVSWDDVGGLVELKEEIMKTIMLPLQRPELLASGLRRSGILLYGPPGTGKTLLAKAIATECNLNFLSVKGPELLNMYVGQSEENVREVFGRARAASPCIIFFDELDSLAPNRGRSGDSGGVMDRVVSQLLAEMDGLQKSTHLFVIGATNRPDLIDPALLRPGRFDKLLFVGMCGDRSSQLSVMKALTRRFQLNDVNLEDVVALLPNKLTGADLYSVCSGAWLSAVRTHISSSAESERTAITSVEVKIEDFEKSIRHLMPSVSEEDLLYYESIKEKM